MFDRRGEDFNVTNPARHRTFARQLDHTSRFEDVQLAAESQGCHQDCRLWPRTRIRLAAQRIHACRCHFVVPES